MQYFLSSSVNGPQIGGAEAPVGACQINEKGVGSGLATHDVVLAAHDSAGPSELIFQKVWMQLQGFLVSFLGPSHVGNY